MRAVVFLLVLGLIPTIAVEAAEFDAFEYRNVGPARGGRATAVAGTVVEPGTFYLGASGGGVWKTTDYGTTWNNVSDGFFASPSIGDIAVAQNDSNIVFVGTGSDGPRSNVIRGNGMYKSIDGGETWQHIGLTETGHIGAVEIDPNNHNIVWVAAIGQAFNANEERGLFKTIDGGKTWNKVLYFSDEVGVSDLELLPGNSDIVFATAWRAERKPWTIVSGGAADRGLPPGGRVDAVEPSPHDPAKAYIAVLRYQLGDWKPYIYKTQDYGKRWRANRLMEHWSPRTR